MRISKKILACVLAALMAISMMPFTAFAATVSVATGAELKAAIANAVDGDVIEFTADNTTYPETSGALVIPVDGKDITIDLKGHTQYFRVSGETTVSYPTDLFVLKNGAKLTVEDSVGGGAIYTTYGGNSAAYTFNVLDTSELVINGGTYVIDQANYGGVVVYQNVATASTTINGGTFTANTGARARRDYLINNTRGEVEINGGEFSTPRSFDYIVNAGNTADTNVTINDGDFEGTISGTTGKIVINGGTFKTYDGAVNDISKYLAEDAVEGPDGTVTSGYVAKIGSDYYETFEAAFAAATAGDTITLVADVVTDTPIVVAADKNIKLDLNGKSISGYVTEAQGKKLIQVSGELEFVGNNGGCIYATNTSGQGYAACQALTGGKITVNSPIHFGDSDTDMTNANTVNRGCGIQNNGGTLIINDGYYTAIDSDYVSKPNKYAYAILNCAGDTIINNATVYGEPNGNLGCESGTLTVNGGSYEVKSANYYSLYCFGGVTTVNDGTFVNNGAFGLNYLGTGAETVIKGGTFTYTAPFNNSGSKGNPIVSGGTFSNEVAAKYIEEKYECVGPTEGWYTIVPAAVDTMSITVEDDIDLNIYLDDSNASESYNRIKTIEYTYNVTPDLEQETMETVTVPATRNADDKVVLKIDLAPGQIRDEIRVRAITEAGEEVRDFTTSIADYCDTIINGNYPANLKDLAKSTLDYGKGASRYFGYNTNAYNNYSIQLDDPTSQINTIAAAAANNTIDTNKFTITGVSYRATSKPEIRFYIDPTTIGEDELEGYNRTVVSTIGTAYFAKHDDDYLLIVKDIDIVDFGKQFVVTVKDSHNELYDWDVVHFTPITWVKAALASSDEDLVFLAKTIGNYYLKSVNYFGA